jgi:hypothetical protein
VVVGRGGDAREQLVRLGGAQDVHRAIAQPLGERRVERHELVVQLGGVLVDRGEQRRAPREAASKPRKVRANS